MSDVLNNIMTFINNNTYLLIGICAFLILVLIGYLIDNNIKSKKVIKDVESTSNKVTEENISVTTDNNVTKVEEKLLENTFENGTETIDVPDSLMNKTQVNNEVEEPTEIEVTAPITNDIVDNEPVINTEPKIFESATPIVNSELNIETNATDELTFNNEIQNPIIETKDSDIDIMNKKETDTIYSNNKSLFEILSDVDKSKPEVKISEESKVDLFSSKPDIKINTNVEDKKVEIEPKYDGEDELDKIMKKLSSRNLTTEEDNYTNIF